MQKELPLLSIKLKMPEPRKSYIIRQNLFNQLKHLKDYKLTILKAGAGSGKTTLVSSFIKETKEEKTKWLTLDENANQVFVFWGYFIKALKEYLGDTTADFSNFFNSNMQKDNMQYILSLLINKLSENENILLVLDDFHMITDSFLIETLDYFIQNMSSNMHLVLLTRNMPLIYLGAVGMEGSLLLIEEEAFRLTEEECTAFLKNTLHLEREENQLKKMIEISKGWIGGLQLLAVAAKENKLFNEMYTFPFSNRLIEDYISKEIFVFLTKEEQVFLIKTSILRYFSEKIFEKYESKVNFKTMIHSIKNKNLFVIEVDEQEGIYRYHALLLDYLKTEFEKLEEEQRISLHRLAANSYYAQGDYEETLYHLFSIKDYEEIMKTILEMPQTALTFSYVEKVPMQEIIHNRDFAYQYYFYYYASLNLDFCEKIYCFIKKNMAQDNTFTAFQHADLFFNDKWELSNIKILSLKQIDAFPLNPVTLAFTAIKEACFLYVLGEYEKAIVYLDYAEKLFKKTKNIYIGFFVMLEKAQIYEDQGELNLALRIYDKLEKMVSQCKGIEPCLYIGVAGVYIKQFALQSANKALEKAGQLLSKVNGSIDRALQYTLAEYFYIIGQTEKTEKILKNVLGEGLDENICFSARLLRYPIYRQKNKGLAVEFTKNYQESESIMRVMDCDLLYTIIQYEQGTIEKAIDGIEVLIGKARKQQNKLKIIEGDLFKMHILINEKGSKRDILNLLVEAVTYGVENTIILPFWFEQEMVIKVMEEMKEDIKKQLSTKEWAFASKIIALDNKKEVKESKGPTYDLTEREKEVLQELEKGSTNKQVAEELCISLATVKSHIINIYSKLGVNNRVAAINKANALGL